MQYRAYAVCLIPVKTLEAEVWYLSHATRTCGQTGPATTGSRARSYWRELLRGGSVGTSVIGLFLFRCCSVVGQSLLSFCGGCARADRLLFRLCWFCAEALSVYRCSLRQMPCRLLDSGPNPANQSTRYSPSLPTWMRAEMGAVAPVVRHAHPGVITCLEAVMAPKSRERISIDLQGLKPALLARSQAQGVSPSELVREALEKALSVPAQAKVSADLRPSPTRSRARANLCLRMERESSLAVVAAVKRSGMSPGDCVAGLVAGVPVLLNGGSRSEHIEALTVSSFHLSSLSPNIHSLTRLLTQANVAQAQVYRGILDALEGDVMCVGTSYSHQERWLNLGSQDR